MASYKFVFMFLVLFVATQCASANPRSRRDAPAEEKPATDTLKSIQNFFKENLQFDKVIEDLKEFGEKVQTGTKDFANTVQQKAQEIFKTSGTETKA